LEHARVEQLLRLEEERIQSMEALEHEQRLRKVFVDRHRKRNEERTNPEHGGIGTRTMATKGIRRPSPEEERRMFRQREGRIVVPVTIRLDARKVTVMVDRTVLDRERGSRHVPIGQAFRRSTSTVGERISPKTVLRKVAIQPFSPYKRFGRDNGGRPDHGQEIEQP
jgi:hypothetical protein